jgi:hypothetical protein
MKLFPALPLACALLLPCALSAESFQGKVTMTMTSEKSSTGPQSMEWLMKDGFMKMNFSVSKGVAASMIMDTANRQMIILMPQQRMYMVQQIPQPGQMPQAQQKARETNVQVTTSKETILGYECTKIVATSPDGTSEIWVTDQLGTFMGMTPGGGGMMGHHSEAPAAWEAAISGKGFFPMRVVTSRNGKGTFKLEVTSVEKMHLSDADFAPPDGWRKFDMGALMGGYGRPPGGSN